MKTFSKILLLTGVMLTSTAFAQERTRVQSDALPRATMMDIYVTGGNQAAVQFKMSKDGGIQQLPLAQFKYFYMFEPEDFQSAMESYQNDNFREAKAKFGKVKTRLAAMQGLPDNYSQEAALYELDSAIRLLDWASVKTLCDSFPKQVPLIADEAQELEVNQLFAKLADNSYDALLADTQKMLADKKKWTLPQLGRIYYILGVAQAAKNQPEALDSLAVPVVASHGGEKELAASAILTSLDILLKNDKVVAFMKSVPSSSTVAQKSKAPLELKEAAALAYFYKNILCPDRVLNPKYDALLAYYTTPSARQAKPATPAPATAAPATTPAAPAPAPAKK
ncbi:MAG: hypothetical protein RR506_05800 [Akkermansia sp.]